MKTFIRLLIPSIMLFMASCSTTYIATGGDDVYYVPKKGAQATEATTDQAGENYSKSSQTKSTQELQAVNRYEEETEAYEEYATEPSHSAVLHRRSRATPTLPTTTVTITTWMITTITPTRHVCEGSTHATIQGLAIIMVTIQICSGTPTTPCITV
jgi:hypothetical protein